MDRPELTAEQWKAAHLRLLTAFRDLWWAAEKVANPTEGMSSIGTKHVGHLRGVLAGTIEFTA